MGRGPGRLLERTIDSKTPQAPPASSTCAETEAWEWACVWFGQDLTTSELGLSVLSLVPFCLGMSWRAARVWKSINMRTFTQDPSAAEPSTRCHGGLQRWTGCGAEFSLVGKTDTTTARTAVMGAPSVYNAKKVYPTFTEGCLLGRTVRAAEGHISFSSLAAHCQSHRIICPGHSNVISKDLFGPSLATWAHIA